MPRPAARARRSLRPMASPGESPAGYLDAIPLQQPDAASRVFRSGYANVFAVPKHRARAAQAPQRPRGGLGAGAGTYAPPAAAAPPPSARSAAAPGLPPGLARYGGVGLAAIHEEESLGASTGSSGLGSSVGAGGTSADELEAALLRVAEMRAEIEESIVSERAEYDVHRAEVRRRLANAASEHFFAVTSDGAGSAAARRIAADVAALAEQLRQEEALTMAQLAREREKWERLIALEREAAELKLYSMRVELLEMEEAETAHAARASGNEVPATSQEALHMMQQLKQMRRQLRRQLADATSSGADSHRSVDESAHPGDTSASEKRKARSYTRVSNDAASLLLNGPSKAKSGRVGKLVTSASLLDSDRPPSPELTPTEAADAAVAIERKLREAGGLEKLLNTGDGKGGASRAAAAGGPEPPLAMSRRFWTSSRNPTEEPAPATQEEIEAYAVYLGMDVEADRELLWIAHKALTAPIPAGWVEYLDPEGKEFFYNKEQNISSYEHPMDDHYRELFAMHKAKKAPPGAALEISAPQGGFSRKLRGLPSGLITAARGLQGGKAPLSISRRFWSRSQSLAASGAAPAPPTREEICDYARYLGIDLDNEAHLLHLAERAIMEPLPEGWQSYDDENGKEFFHCAATNVSSYEHPMDERYRELIRDARGNAGARLL